MRSWTRRTSRRRTGLIARKRVAVWQILQGILAALLVVGLILGLTYYTASIVYDSRPFVETTNTYEFVRHIDEDEGQLDPTQVLAREDSKISLASLVGELADRDTSRFGRYHQNLPYSEGLEVVFTVMNGKRIVSRDSYPIIVALKRREEVNNGDRDRAVMAAERNLRALSATFTAPRERHREYSVVLDVTEGWQRNSRLDQAVHNQLAEIQKIAGNGCARFSAYKTTASAYQGENRNINSCGSNAFDEAVSWVTESHPAEKRSSVLGGLSGALSAIAERVKTDPLASVQVDIWSDGLENTDELNLYRKVGRELSEEDKTAIRETLSVPENSLVSLVLRLHPTPQKSEVLFQLELTVLTEIARVLRDVGGATVTVMSF